MFQMGKPKNEEGVTTPRMPKHPSASLSSSQRFNDSYEYGNKNKLSAITSERPNLQHQRSSAEASEIEREVNKHKKYSATSMDSKFDPEAMKKQLMNSMQIQLQTIITKIGEKEKQYMEQEKLYSKLQ